MKGKFIPKLIRGNISMKIISFLGILIIFGNNVLVAQEYFIGASPAISIYNSNSLTGLGLSIHGEYQSRISPFSYRLSAKYYWAEFENYNPYLSTHSHTLITIDCNILYHFTRVMTNTYMGLGVGYNFVIIEESGNLNTVGEFYTRIKDPQFPLSLNIILGANIAIGKTFFLVTELLYRFIKLHYNVELNGRENDFIIRDSDVLHDVLLNFGFKIRL